MTASRPSILTRWAQALMAHLPGALHRVLDRWAAQGARHRAERRRAQQRKRLARAAG